MTRSSRGLLEKFFEFHLVGFGGLEAGGLAAKAISKGAVENAGSGFQQDDAFTDGSGADIVE